MTAPWRARLPPKPVTHFRKVGEFRVGGDCHRCSALFQPRAPPSTRISSYRPGRPPPLTAAEETDIPHPASIHTLALGQGPCRERAPLPQVAHGPASHSCSALTSPQTAVPQPSVLAASSTPSPGPAGKPFSLRSLPGAAIVTLYAQFHFLRFRLPLVNCSPKIFRGKFQKYTTHEC